MSNENKNIKTKVNYFLKVPKYYFMFKKIFRKY